MQLLLLVMVTTLSQTSQCVMLVTVMLQILLLSMAAVQTRMDAIAAALEDIHAIHIEEDGIHPIVCFIYHVQQWNAFWDFMCIYEDNSNGVHNPCLCETIANCL
jgi:hypothetical protein